MFEEEAIAVFGEARLVRKRNGDYELLGGVAADRTAAKDLRHLGSAKRNSATPSERARASQWISLFMHEAAISFCPGPA